MAPGHLAERVALTAIVALALFLVALDGGGYALTSRTALGVLLSWTIVVGMAAGFWPRARVSIDAMIVGGFLLAFALWTGVSASWAESNERAFNEFDRVTLYLLVFLLPVLAAPRGRTARRWIRGLALGIVAIGILALGSRLAPQLYPDDATGPLTRSFAFSENRLIYPLDYWNGLATFVALGIPPLLFLAGSRRSPWFVRGAMLAPIPVLAAVIYLASSRGGIVTAALATGSYLALTSRRLATVGAVLIAGAGSAAAVAVLHAHPELVERQAGIGTADVRGTSAAALIALVCLAVGALYALAIRLLPPPRPFPAAAAWGIAAACVIALVLALAAVHPGQRFDNFTRAPDVTKPQPRGTHLLSGSGSGRWQLWQSAVDEYRDHPVRGGGAGSYEAWWAEHGTLQFFVRDAHSLYAETLGELGLVGLALLLSVLIAALVLAIRRLLTSTDDARAVTAALVAVLIAYLFEAGIDWMWEETAVSIVAFIAVGLLVGPATRFDGKRGRRFFVSVGRGPLIALRTAGVLAALALVLAQALPLLAQTQLDRSRRAVAEDDAQQALDAAASARRLEPWAASPYLQLALVQEQAGALKDASRSIAAAIERDRADWRLWLVASRVQTKLGDFRAAQQSYRRAASLNPRSFLFQR